MISRTARLSQQRRAEIANMAERVAESRFPGKRVEPEMIATQEGIAFRYASFPEEFDGVLLHEGGRFFIVCNERRAARGTPRSRFTFAHELGHFFLEDHRSALASGLIPPHFSLAESVSDQPIERESDCFATHLLMPMGLFYERIGTFSSQLEQISELATFFGTSVTATAFRALELELFSPPAAVLCWDALGAPKGRRMSPATLADSDDGCRLTDSIPENSSTIQAVKSFATTSRAGRSAVGAWFPHLGMLGAADDLMLREEVMSLGQFGWLTLVYRDDSWPPRRK